MVGIKQNEELGQHFLVDKGIISLLANKVVPGSVVIEVGAGEGQLTEALAKIAGRVVAIEIDDRYQGVLGKVAKRHHNVDVRIANALDVDFSKLVMAKEATVQVVASLPFHISEPFLQKIATTPIGFTSAVLVVGDRLAYAITQDEGGDLVKENTVLLVKTFFHTKFMCLVKKSMFNPPPRTDAAVVELIPRERWEFLGNKAYYLLRRLFLSARHGPLVVNALKEGLIEFERETRGIPAGKREEVLLTKKKAKEVVGKMGLSDDLLHKSLSQLNNQEIGELWSGLNSSFNN